MPGSDRVHLWLVEPHLVRGASLREYATWLATEERRKAAAFHSDTNRHEYIVTRALERTSLAGYLGRSPRSLEFARDAKDRPHLVPDVGVRYSLSNRPALVACLVSDRYEVGVDVEPHARAPGIEEMARSVFAKEERAALENLPAPEARRRLVELWTLKESYVKALGVGLELPLDSFWFDIRPGAIELRLEREAAADTSRWDFRLLDFKEHTIAICIGCHPSRRVVVERFEPLL